MRQAGSGMTREAVAVFQDWSSLEAAVDELKAAGFPDEAYSLLADRSTVQEKLGHLYSRVEELEDDPAAPRTAFTSLKPIAEREALVVGSMSWLPPLLAVGVVVASAGTIAAALAATAMVGAGIAPVLAEWMDRRQADRLEEQIERGGILLWVTTPDEASEAAAIAILTRHADHDVHIHDLPGTVPASNSAGTGLA